MSVTITDNRTIIDEADVITGWTTSTAIATVTSSPTPIESTAALSAVVSTATHNFYVTISSTGMSGDGYLIYFWMSHRADFDTVANGGVQIQIGDGTNRVGYHVAGSDGVGFAHFTGPVVWQSLVLDTGNLAAYSSTTYAGAAGSLNRAAITQVGIAFKTLVKSVGGVANCFWDISRYLNPGTNDGAAVTVTGGTSGDPGTFANIAAADQQIGNQQAYGVVRELGSGLYGVQGPLRFGNSSGTSSSWFENTNIIATFESRNTTTNKYKIIIVDNGTGTTTFKLGTKVGSGSTATGKNGVSFIVPSGVGGKFDSGTDTDVTDVFIYGSSFSGFTNGIVLGASQEFINNTVSASGTITAGGATLVNCIITNSTATPALSWNVNSDTSGILDGCKFTSAGTGHAVELGSNTPASISFSNITFTGYGANGTTDACVYNNSGKSITINVSGGDTPTVRNGAGASTTVISSVTVTIHVENTSQQAIQNARVYVTRDSDSSVIINGTLTNSSGNATGSTVSGAGAITIRVRKSSTGTTRYVPVTATGTVGGSNLTVNVTMTQDSIASS